MNNEDLQQLKALALAATPGPWYSQDQYADNGEFSHVGVESAEGDEIIGEEIGPCSQDTKYIAAANPATILALIERIESLAAPVVANAENSDALPAAEYDKDMDRNYLPLPNGWEIQTKGKGSTFRICKVNGKDDYERWAVTDQRLHEALQRMAEDCRAAIAAQTKPAVTLTDEQVKAAAMQAWPDLPADWWDRKGAVRSAVDFFAKAILAHAAPNAQLVDALRDITNDYAERFDLDSPRTNPGIKNCIEQARAALASLPPQKEAL